MSDKLGLYVHIPFCIRKCLYCDFVSVSANKDYIDKYFKSLYEEIKCFKVNKSCSVDTIYIGGGTPSSVDEKYIKELFEIIYLKFDVDDDAEITIEMNPGTVSMEKLKVYKECKINRISIGAQSMCDEELRKIGRIHTVKDLYECVRMARSVGFDNINIDLMSALPGQSLDDYKDNLYKIIELRPKHISSYSLIIEEGTPFYEMYEGKNRDEISEQYRLADEDEERAMYKLTREVLAGNGYERYEISNYCMKGFASRHNSRYWQGMEYVGFGAAAASYYEGRRFKNTLDIDKYISSNPIPKDEDYILTKEDKMEEYMFLGMRMIKGVSASLFRETFGLDIMDVYKEVIERNVARGLIEYKNDCIYLTQEGIDVSNLVFSEFLL